MLKKISAMVILSLAVGLSACSTRQIAQSPTVALSPQIQDQAITTSIQTSIQSLSKRDWRVESVTPDRVVAGLDYRGHYLQVTYFIEQHRVRSEITASQNFSQHGSQIHRKALKFKAGLDRRVFQKLAKL
ncbi:hypothetical protein [Acinetobacter sp. MD2]|uniref:hypothetical protein n=1 Tax=Acinetobacter sp. MD2 TaxID=2600066 RepID=UPI002D1F7101|nr:hypothetical protein [Acinetobacter sp. MD2]MEB3767089.1 hypothetical protein [Acinetobacter sp. MD2]